MELPDAVWGPYDFQMSSNWTMEEPAVWAPGLPVEYYQYATTETFGSYLRFPRYGSEDLIEKEGAQEFEVDVHDHMNVNIHDDAISEFEEEAREFKVDMDMIKMKIHRYPPSLRAFDEWYTVPRMVAIGPYHKAQIFRDQVEKAKHVAAYRCVRESGHSLHEVYGAVVSAALDCRHLYDKNVIEGMGDSDFLTMMFYDACLLVQYMLWCTTPGINEMDPSLCSFFDLNRKVLRHDLMLLENQLPWRVVQTVMRFRPVNLVDFIADWRNYLQDRKILVEKPVVLDDSYEPPHLLGFLRFYFVGKRSTKLHTPAKLSSISVSVSAIELAEIGITLTAAKDTRELIHMDLNMRGAGILSAELSMAPLSLDDERASFLINMAALELCTTSNFLKAEAEDSAVCSYLLLLSMLVHREEDVHELRTKHLLQGGAGMINKDALDFFTKLQSLPLQGSCYVRVMVDIEKYKLNRRMLTKVHAFLYKNKKIIFAAFSVISVVVSILGTLVSLKTRS